MKRLELLSCERCEKKSSFLSKSTIFEELLCVPCWIHEEQEFEQYLTPTCFECKKKSTYLSDSQTRNVQLCEKCWKKEHAMITKNDHPSMRPQ